MNAYIITWTHTHTHRYISELLLLILLEIKQTYILLKKIWMVLIHALDIEHLWVGCCDESCSLLCLQADASHKASIPRLTSSTHARRAPPSPPHAYFLWNPKDDLHTTFQRQLQGTVHPNILTSRSPWHVHERSSEQTILLRCIC